MLPEQWTGNNLQWEQWTGNKKDARTLHGNTPYPPHSKGHFSRSKWFEKGQIWLFLLLLPILLKSGLITFLYILYTASLGWYIYWSTVKRWIYGIIQNVIFKVGKVRFSSFSHNYWYYSIITKCCPNLLHHVAFLLWNQSCPKIWKVWNHSKGHFQGQKGPFQLISQKRHIVWWKFVWNTYSKSYMAFQFTWWNLTLDVIQRSNQGQWHFSWLLFINEACYV